MNWQGAAPREDAREYDPNEGRPGKDGEKGDRGYEVLEIFQGIIFKE